MNLRFAVVEKSSQIEQGAVYVIRGDSRNNVPIPPQVFRVESTILRAGAVGRTYVVGTSWVNLGEFGKRIFTNQVLFLDAVGIYEQGTSELTDYSKMAKITNPLDHGRHLERVPQSLQQAFFGTKNNYHEVMNHNSNGLVIK